MYKRLIMNVIMIGMLICRAEEVKPELGISRVGEEDRAFFEKIPMVKMEFQNASLREAINALALVSGINYQLDKIEEQHISMQIMMNPFKALELLAERNNLRMTRVNGMWFIGNNATNNKFQKKYELKNIHLGAMGYKPQGSGKKSEMNDKPIVNAGMNTTVDIMPKATDTQAEAMENTSNGEEIVKKIKELIAVGGEKDSFVTYDPDANTLFAVANEKQHSWIENYLRSLDKRVHNVEMEIKFISTSENPESHLGVDWSGTLGEGMNLSASQVDAKGIPTGLTYGTLGHLHAPRSAIVKTDALNLKLQAWDKKADNETKKYPLVTSYANRPVILDFTRNEPVVTQTIDTNIQTSTDIMSSGTTNRAQITQERVGTVVKLLPRIIEGQRISLDIDINVSNILSYKRIEKNSYPIISQTHYCGQTVAEGGNTIVVGGLEETIADRQEEGVSFLSNLPVFGWLFKDVKKSDQKKKLTLLISVRLLDASGKEVTTVTLDEGKSKCLAKLESKMNEIKEALK